MKHKQEELFTKISKYEKINNELLLNHGGINNLLELKQFKAESARLKDELSILQGKLTAMSEDFTQQKQQSKNVEADRDKLLNTLEKVYSEIGDIIKTKKTMNENKYTVGQVVKIKYDFRGVTCYSKPRSIIKISYTRKTCLIRGNSTPTWISMKRLMNCTKEESAQAPKSSNYFKKQFSKRTRRSHHKKHYFRKQYDYKPTWNPKDHFKLPFKQPDGNEDIIKQFLTGLPTTSIPKLTI